MSAPTVEREGATWDVLVTGGGTAGLAAAISAARAGATVLLLERSDVLGGNATQAFVHTFCGLFLPPVAGEELKYANPGFASRLSQWLLVSGGALPAEVHGKVGVLPTLPQKMDGLLRQACAALAPRLDVLDSAALGAVAVAGPNHFSFAWERAGANHTARARIIIDTTGDAHAAAALGLPLDESRREELQHPTFIFRVEGAHPPDLEGYRRLKLSGAFNRAARSGQLPAECDSVLVRPTGVPGEAYISLNMPKPQDSYNPLDENYLRGMESTARSWAQALVELLREQPGWQACSVLEWPRRLGVRETRRILGHYQMTTEDILEGRSFADEVALSTWPIEMWNRHTGADFRQPVGPCGVPLRSLVSLGHPRLGMAGRCMSGTHEALGALRVMGTGLATGEAIGIAAALACRREVDLSTISASDVRSAREQIHLQAGDQP